MKPQSLARWIEVESRDPLPSVEDICRTVGIRPQQTAPGDQFTQEIDVAMYWPVVRPAWEEER